MIIEKRQADTHTGSVRQNALLTEQQLEAFTSKGFLVYPSFLSPELTGLLIREVGYWVDAGLREKATAKARSSSPPEVMEIDLEIHGWLASHPPMRHILEQLTGPEFAFPHLSEITY